MLSRSRVPAARRAVTKRAAAAGVAAIALASGCGSAAGPSAPPGAPPAGDAAPARPATSSTTRYFPRPPAGTFRCPCPNLQPGSNPAVLPAPVLIADHMNNRLLIIDPNGRIVWTFAGARPGPGLPVPDDAFFTPDGRRILATQEDDQTISLIDIASRRTVWTYGTPGAPGMGPDQLNHPDDAMMTSSGDVVLADIKNCRVILLRPGAPGPVKIYGEATNECVHAPPQRWGSPNGAFPTRSGYYLVTEINGDWVDGLTPSGQVAFETHPPGVAYPSDTNEVSRRIYLTADYSSPGQLVEFDRTGRLSWRYAPTGAAALNHPSLALPLPNGDILCNDDFNDRVIVVDPRTNRVVWQYGHTGAAGTAAGYLSDPDGVDLSPPFSLTMVFAQK